MTAFPPVGSVRTRPQTVHSTTEVALSKMSCSFSQSGHFTFRNLLRFSRFAFTIFQSLRKFEFACAEAWAKVCFSTLFAAVADVDLLGRLVSSRNLAELSTVSNLASACLLAVDPVETGGSSLLYLFNLVLSVLAAVWAVGVELYWFLHNIYPF